MFQYGKDKKFFMFKDVLKEEKVQGSKLNVCFVPKFCALSPNFIFKFIMYPLKFRF